jgi:hypothetical protein
LAPQIADIQALTSQWGNGLAGDIRVGLYNDKTKLTDSANFDLPIFAPVDTRACVQLYIKISSDSATGIDWKIIKDDDATTYYGRRSGQYASGKLESKHPYCIPFGTYRVEAPPGGWGDSGSYHVTCSVDEDVNLVGPTAVDGDDGKTDETFVLNADSCSKQDILLYASKTTAGTWSLGDQYVKRVLEGSGLFRAHFTTTDLHFDSSHDTRVEAFPGKTIAAVVVSDS